MPLTQTCSETANGRQWRLTHGLAKALAFIQKDLTVAVSYKLQFVFQFSHVFFNIVLIYFIGKMVAASGTSPVLAAYGADYFSFALVGLAVNSYLKTGVVTVTNDLRQMMNQGVLEALCAGPIGHGWLLFCAALWPFLFETVRVVFYFVLALAVFGLRLREANWPGACIVLLATIPIFLMLGILSCSILIVVKKGDPVNWMFSSISGLLAGTMFPVTVLPHWLQIVAFCLPQTHALEALRRCLLTGSSLWDMRHHLLALMLFMAILLPTTLVISHLCIAHARRSGALATH
jgi:ABC-2 type transport system permease protein